MRERLGLLIAATMLVPTCASASPYHEAHDPGKVGYTDERVDPARYVVTFRGDGSMSPERVYRYALLRAAEVTLDRDFNWFYVVRRDLPAGDASASAGVPDNAVTLDIVMGHGKAPPKNPDAFDAHDLRKELKELK